MIPVLRKPTTKEEVTPPLEKEKKGKQRERHQNLNAINVKDMVIECMSVRIRRKSLKQI